MVYLVVFASCGALCFQNIGIEHVPAAPAALLLSTESLFGVTFAVLFFGDTLTITAVIGFALIAFGIAVSETFPTKERKFAVIHDRKRRNGALLHKKPRTLAGIAPKGPSFVESQRQNKLV